MRIFDALKQVFSKGALASTLPLAPLPKAPNKPVSLPGYRTRVEVSTTALPRKDRLLATTDRLSARDLADTRKTVVELYKSSPDISSAVSFLLRTGIPERFTIVARDMDGKINVQACALAQELLRRLTYMGNADGSFGNQQGLQSLSEQLALELILQGAACLELALDKARVPASLNPISVPTLVIFEEDNSFKLVQRIGGQDIDLDLPTIIYTSVDQMQNEAYASSYIEAAIQPTLADVDFNNDMRRALKRSILPRLVASIKAEAVKKMIPPNILADSEKYAAYINELIAEVKSVVDNAAPEDAFITFDTVEYTHVTDTSSDPGALVERIQKVLNGKLAAGAKTLPVILGHGGSSNASSTEAMLYVKQANMIRVKLNEMYSRAFTVAIRLLGQDCYVDFKYASIDLRPESELEAYKAMEQSRVLELLSLGMLTDEDACLTLTGNLPPTGYVPKMGTMFKSTTSQTPSANPASNTSAISQTLKSDAPTQPKSPTKA